MTPQYITTNLPEILRKHACPAGKPWTRDTPEVDHGHTSCYLYHLAATEIERLRGLLAPQATPTHQTPPTPTNTSNPAPQPSNTSPYPTTQDQHRDFLQTPG